MPSVVAYSAEVVYRAVPIRLYFLNFLPQKYAIVMCRLNTRNIYDLLATHRHTGVACAVVLIFFRRSDYTGSCTDAQLPMT